MKQFLKKKQTNMYKNQRNKYENQEEKRTR